MTPVYKLSASSIKGRTNYGSMLAGNTAFVPPSFESIATVTVGSGGSSTIEFANIPGTYTHLQLRINAKTSSNDTGTQIYVNINSTSLAHIHRLRGNGSTATAVASASTSEIGYLPASATADANKFGSFILDILDYANTNKNKTLRTLGGYDINGDGLLQLNSGLYNSTSAVTSISFTAQDSRNFTQYSHFALYGIKSA